MNKDIEFIKYNGIEGYIELMKHDVEPLNNPDCTKLELCYNGKDIKAVLDYITNLQKEIERLKEYRESYKKELDFWRIQFSNKEERINEAIEVLKNLSENEYYYKYNNKYLKSEIIDNLLSILKGEE